MLLPIQNNCSFGQINPKKTLSKNNQAKLNNKITVTRCSAGSSEKQDIVDKFFNTKFGKLLKKIYCFGLDIDALM